MKSLRDFSAAVATTAMLATIVVATPARAEQGGGRGACRADVEKLCPDAKPGDGSARECLKSHKDELSDACKQAMARWHGHHRHEKGGQSSGGAEGGSAPEGGSQEGAAAE